MFLYTSFKKNWKKLNIRVKVKKKKKTPGLHTYFIGNLEKEEIAVSPIHHMREVYICPNSSGHKADQLTNIQLFQVWSLHSSTFETIDYFFVCVCR